MAVVSTGLRASGLSRPFCRTGTSEHIASHSVNSRLTPPSTIDEPECYYETYLFFAFTFDGSY